MRALTSFNFLLYNLQKRFNQLNEILELDVFLFLFSLFLFFLIFYSDYLSFFSFLILQLNKLYYQMNFIT